MTDISIGNGACVSFMSYLVQKSCSIVHTDIRALERYWQELRAGRPCPFRAEVDPRDIRSKISNLFILEDLGLGNVRFRIAGTALVDAFGMELRGMPVRSMMEMRARQSFAELIAETLAEPGVGYARLRRSTGRGEPWEIILLPLRSDHCRVDRIIGALHCLDPHEGDNADTPLRFVIDEMAITPVDVTAPSTAYESYGAQGFAEPSSRYMVEDEQPADTRPRLESIEGGRAADEPSESPEAQRRRRHLRVISED